MMEKFECVWSDFYFSGEPSVTGLDMDIYIHHELAEDEKITILTCGQGKTRVSIAPQMAAQLCLEHTSAVNDLGSFRTRLSEAGIEVHSPDRVYFSEQPVTVNLAGSNIEIRSLSEADTQLYAEFKQDIDDDEWDNAWVELDHWQVFGLFLHDKLISACSLYPWRQSHIADLGVITAPAFRGQGMAKKLVNYAHGEIAKHGYILQYRTQVDNEPSIKLAESLGLRFYGTWESVIDS